MPEQVTTRYRKKPVVIEARQLTPENAQELLQWIDAGKNYIGPNGHVDGLKILTLEGPMKADFGDWIIRGVKGEFYPCKPDVFEVTYEPDAYTCPNGVPVGPAGCCGSATCDEALMAWDAAHEPS